MCEVIIESTISCVKYNRQHKHDMKLYRKRMLLLAVYPDLYILKNNKTEIVKKYLPKMYWIMESTLDYQ